MLELVKVQESLSLRNLASLSNNYYYPSDVVSMLQTMMEKSSRIQRLQAEAIATIMSAAETTRSSSAVSVVDDDLFSDHVLQNIDTDVLNYPRSEKLSDGITIMSNRLTYVREKLDRVREDWDTGMDSLEAEVDELVSGSEMAKVTANVLSSTLSAQSISDVMSAVPIDFKENSDYHVVMDWFTGLHDVSSASIATLVSRITEVGSFTPVSEDDYESLEFDKITQCAFIDSSKYTGKSPANLMCEAIDTGSLWEGMATGIRGIWDGLKALVNEVIVPLASKLSNETKSMLRGESYVKEGNGEYFQLPLAFTKDQYVSFSDDMEDGALYREWNLNTLPLSIYRQFRLTSPEHLLLKALYDSYNLSHDVTGEVPGGYVDLYVSSRTIPHLLVTKWKFLWPKVHSYLMSPWSRARVYSFVVNTDTISTVKGPINERPVTGSSILLIENSQQGQEHYTVSSPGELKDIFGEVRHLSLGRTTWSTESDSPFHIKPFVNGKSYTQSNCLTANNYVEMSIAPVSSAVHTVLKEQREAGYPNARFILKIVFTSAYYANEYRYSMRIGGSIGNVKSYLALSLIGKDGKNYNMDAIPLEKLYHLQKRDEERLNKPLDYFAVQVEFSSTGVDYYYCCPWDDQVTHVAIGSDSTVSLFKRMFIDDELGDVAFSVRSRVFSANCEDPALFWCDVHDGPLTGAWRQFDSDTIGYPLKPAMLGCTGWDVDIAIPVYDVSNLNNNTYEQRIQRVYSKDTTFFYQTQVSVERRHDFIADLLPLENQALSIVGSRRHTISIGCAAPLFIVGVGFAAVGNRSGNASDGIIKGDIFTVDPQIIDEAGVQLSAFEFIAPRLPKGTSVGYDEDLAKVTESLVPEFGEFIADPSWIQDSVAPSGVDSEIHQAVKYSVRAWCDFLNIRAHFYSQSMKWAAPNKVRFPVYGTKFGSEGEFMSHGCGKYHHSNETAKSGWNVDESAKMRSMLIFDAMDSLIQFWLVNSDASYRSYDPNWFSDVMSSIPDWAETYMSMLSTFSRPTMAGVFPAQQGYRLKTDDENMAAFAACVVAAVIAVVAISIGAGVLLKSRKLKLKRTSLNAQNAKNQRDLGDSISSLSKMSPDDPAYAERLSEVANLTSQVRKGERRLARVDRRLLRLGGGSNPNSEEGSSSLKDLTDTLTQKLGLQANEDVDLTELFTAISNTNISESKTVKGLSEAIQNIKNLIGEFSDEI